MQVRHDDTGRDAHEWHTGEVQNRRAYEKPVLKPLGTLADITRATGGAPTDGDETGTIS
jgi:hypothetical protein